MSAVVEKNSFFAWSSGTSARLNPVPTGSMNTMSVKSSQVPGLSVNADRIGRTVAFVAGVHVLGADGAEIQIHARCAGTAVERKRHGPVLAFDGVGRSHYLAGDFAILVAHRQRAHRHGVLERLAIELHLLRDVRIGGQAAAVPPCRRAFRRRPCQEPPRACRPGTMQWWTEQQNSRGCRQERH